MSYWVDDPQLFLYAKGTGPGDVLLRRCKKPVSSSSSSLVVPMKSDDFDCGSNVKNYRDLIGDRFDWDETDYKRLVKYIYERLLLVNGQGLVIAEIYKLDDPNEVPIYIRSLDVLPLKPYIPNIRERQIPLRTVKCLEDVNGKAAMMEDDDSNLAKRVADLELKNLKDKVTKSNADLATRTSELAISRNQVADLELKNKTLEGKVTKLTADLVTQMNALTTLQQEVKNNPNYTTKEDWMCDLTTSCEWVDVEGLSVKGTFDDLIILGSPGTFTMDDSSTNVRARYWYKIKLGKGDPFERKAVFLEDMTPNMERARFLRGIWLSFKSKGKTCVLHNSMTHAVP